VKASLQVKLSLTDAVCDKIKKRDKVLNLSQLYPCKNMSDFNKRVAIRGKILAIFGKM